MFLISEGYINATMHRCCKSFECLMHIIHMAIGLWALERQMQLRNGFRRSRES